MPAKNELKVVKQEFQGKKKHYTFTEKQVLAMMLREFATVHNKSYQEVFKKSKDFEQVIAAFLNKWNDDAYQFVKKQYVSLYILFFFVLIIKECSFTHYARPNSKCCL